MPTPPGWYADPSGTLFGALRYFDGTSWTSDVVTPAGPPLHVTWKGAEFHRPPGGPGALADPWLRLLAQFLDGLFLLPVAIAFEVALGFIFFAHLGSISASTSTDGAPTVGFLVTFELWFLGLGALYLMIALCYQAITTAVWGRSPGKAIVHIRPICLDGSPLSWGRSFGRAGAYLFASVTSVLWFLDVLWCLWDDNTQCLHDKVCETLVIHD
jgi:uncharacterized RDD family membrane protein YckC